MVISRILEAFGGKVRADQGISIGYRVAGRPGIPQKTAAVHEAGEVPITTEKEE